jgi:hypothetical protein
MALGKIDTGREPLLAAMDSPDGLLLTQRRNDSGTSESLAPAAQVRLRYKMRRPHPPIIDPNGRPIVEIRMVAPRFPRTPNLNTQVRYGPTTDRRHCR